MSEKFYLTSSEVAERLAVSPKTVGRWAKEGRLGPPRPWAATAASPPRRSTGSSRS
ncbi:MAG TPA: helix-turn-helix domain-containing protein [Actinomycetota bacterium]|jgi:hypothetical protein